MTSASPPIELAERHLAGHGRPAAGPARLHHEPAAQSPGVGLYAPEAPAPFGVVARKADPVVRYRQPETIGIEGQLDLDPAGPGVRNALVSALWAT